MALRLRLRFGVMHLDTYQSNKLTRTLVVKAASEGRYVGNRLIETLQQLLDRMPPWLKRFGAWWVQPYVLLALGALTVGLFAIGLHYYQNFSEEIDSRLKMDSFDNSAQLIGAPVRINRGERFSVEELTSHLEAAGYSKSSGEAAGTQGSYSIVERTIEVVPGARSSARGLQPARIEIDEKQRISTLTGSGGQKLSSVTLDGAVLASMKDGDRRKKIQVQFSEIPAALRNAVTATEDQRFFDHNGIDWRGICRALWIDLRKGEIVQGGSTITQQLIKNAFLTNERSWRRKIKEASMALILESRLSKEEIFTLYCNDVYLGQSGRFAIRGFAEAADVYFNKSLDQLTLAQSAFLAGLVHAPNRYSAHRDLPDALARRAKVLDAMVELKNISVQESEAAKLEPLQFVKRETRDDHGVSYFIDYAERFVHERYGWQALASETYLATTLDMRLQKAAYDSVALHGDRLDKLMGRGKKRSAPPPPVQAALIALDPHTGEVLAMIGGRNYDESQLNRATDALRQPGSTFKPFIYASALSQRSYTAATLLSNRRQSFSYDGGRVEYEPSNYGGTFGNGDVTLADALSRSLNVPTVELALKVGLSTIADFAETCGLPKPRMYPSMALGASEVALMDLAAGYTAFANYGTARSPTPVKAISWPEGDRTEEVRSRGARALSPEMAYLMTNMLSSVVNGGTGSRVRTMGFNGDAAGKTGTSRDGWFVGYTPNLVCAVWVGFDDNRQLGLKGSDSALPIWVDFMKQALAIRPELGGGFKQPAGLSSALIDPTTGLLASVDCPASRQMLFISGTEPVATCTHELLEDPDLMLEGAEGVEQDDAEQLSDELTLEVCAVSGLLPSSACEKLKTRAVKWQEIPLGTCGPELHDGRREPPLIPDKPQSAPQGASTKLSEPPRSPLLKRVGDAGPH
jgi:penicillin-binding protein 1B